MTDQEEQELALKLIDAGFTAELRNQAFACVAPIYWYDAAQKSGPRIRANGTFFFIKLPQACIGVTAHHVFDAYRRCVSEMEAPVLIVGETVCDLATRLVSESPNLDLATFHFDADEVQRKFNRTPHEPAIFPTPNLPEGTGVYFVGFPGQYRREENWDLFWRPFEGSGIARRSSDDRLAVQFEREYVVEDHEWETLPENADIGGMSGAPLFALFQRNDIVFQQVAGIVYEASANFEITFFRPIELVSGAGEIRHEYRASRPMSEQPHS